MIAFAFNYVYLKLSVVTFIDIYCCCCYHLGLKGKVNNNDNIKNIKIHNFSFETPAAMVPITIMVTKQLNFQTQLDWAFSTRQLICIFLLQILKWTPYVSTIRMQNTKGNQIRPIFHITIDYYVFTGVNIVLILTVLKLSIISLWFILVSV